MDSSPLCEPRTSRYPSWVRKGRGTRDQIPPFTGSQRKLENFRKTSTSVLSTTPKPLTVWIIKNCGKLLKRWEYQTILPVSWETCMRVKKQVRTLYRTTDWFKIDKGVRWGCLLSAAWLIYTLMAPHSSVLAWRIPGTGEPGGLLSMESHRVGHDWSDLAAAAEHIMISELQAGIKTGGRNINNLRYMDDTTLMTESEQ